MKRILVLSALIVLLFSQTAMANLVINGDFQSGVPGWTETAYGIGWGDGNFAAAFSYFPGTWSQTISTAPDQWYTFAFLLIHDSPGGTQDISPYYPATQYLDVFWGGSLIFTAPAENFSPGTNNPFSPSTNYTWELFEFTVKATGASTAIAFSGQDTGGFYYLDNVSVSPVPIPSAVLLLGSGLAGVAGYRRRLRRD